MAPAVEDTGSSAAPRYDAIVIGSGFGGAVAACRLAQAGFSVLILERGRRYEAGDFPALPPDDKLLPDLRRWTWQGNQGLWDLVDLEELVSVQAAGYGGGSLIYANVHLRPPAAVFNDGWPEVYANGAILDEYFDLAAYMLEVAPVTAHPGIAKNLVKADQLKQAARLLKRADGLFHPPLTISYRQHTNRHGVEQNACTECGRCCTGCPEKAKNTLDFNYLAAAERHGARALTQCEVLDLKAIGSDGWEVRCLNHLRAERTVFRADNVFVCAGSVHSTRLLARAKLGPEAHATQELVGVGYFPGGDALGVVYDAAHPQLPSRGPAITTALVHWNAPESASFFMLQDGGYGRELERLIGLLRAPAWVGRNRLSRVRSGAAPRVERSPDPAAAPAKARPNGFVLSSLLDELLDARGAGSLASIMPGNLGAALAETLKELQGPLLLPEIVGSTVDRAIRQRWAKLTLTRGWKPERFPLATLIRWEKAIVKRLYGADAALAEHAFSALLNGSDLSPVQLLKRILNYDASGAERRTMLLAMGRDAARGVLHYDKKHDRLYADLELDALAPSYSSEERLMTDVAECLGGELRTNPAWAFLGKPITVHNQGGCRMSDDPKQGVTTPEGAVRGAPGLYVLDGSVLPSSVGVNPSATIAAIAERNVALFIRERRGAAWATQGETPGAREYAEQRRQSRAWVAAMRKEEWHFTPPDAKRVAFKSQPLGLKFSEGMGGYYEPGRHAPCGDASYRRAETRGRPNYPIQLTLHNRVRDLSVFFEDPRHQMTITGEVLLRLPHEATPRTRKTRGYLRLFVQRHKPYAIDRRKQPERWEAQRAVARTYTPSPDPPPPHKQRWMTYHLSFTDESGARWVLRGRKRLRDDPGFDAWRDTTSLFVKLYGPLPPKALPGAKLPLEALAGVGVVHVDATTFLFEQLKSFEITGTDDPARKSWAVAKFATFFFGELQRVYAPELSRAIDTLFRPHVSGTRARSFWQ